MSSFSGPLFQDRRGSSSAQPLDPDSKVAHDSRRERAVQLALGRGPSDAERPAEAGRAARRHRGHLHGAGARLRARTPPQVRICHRLARVLGRHVVTTTHVDDEVIDSGAIRAFTEEFGDLATAMPPVAIVIAAFNEEGAIGPVVDTLPRAVAGLDTVTIVVSDGSVDSTGKEARVAGALVCDVPVNRGQGAALRLGYRLARDGGARYIVTTDADGQYNPAEIESLLAPILAD